MRTSRGIRLGDRCEQRLRVGVSRALVENVGGCDLQSLPRYITATRSLTCFTTARSWAMKTMVSPILTLMSSRRFRICACTETSSGRPARRR